MHSYVGSAVRTTLCCQAYTARFSSLYWIPNVSTEFIVEQQQTVRSRRNVYYAVYSLHAILSDFSICKIVVAHRRRALCDTKCEVISSWAQLQLFIPLLKLYFEDLQSIFQVDLLLILIFQVKVHLSLTEIIIIFPIKKYCVCLFSRLLSKCYFFCWLMESVLNSSFESTKNCQTTIKCLFYCEVISKHSISPIKYDESE